MNVDKYSMKQLKPALDLEKALNVCVCIDDCPNCVLYGNRDCPEHHINSLRLAIKLKDEQPFIKMMTKTTRLSSNKSVIALKILTW